MELNKHIKWCAIQPLTGGMYLGAEKVIGHPAEFILSYPGVGEPIYNKSNNELIGGGNEYHLMTYLDKVKRRPEYKVFDRAMFQNDRDINPLILNTRWTLNPDKELDYTDIDLCVAVPVCSGLSTATIGTDEAKATRNSNMIYISTYALKVIKPKIYIFENAPTFLSIRGEYVRRELEKLAKETGYSLVYYRTDTMYHDNCQKRKRTFIIFFNKEFAPQMNYEHIETNIGEYFSRIIDKKDDTELDWEFVNCINYFIIEYFKRKLGDTWREQIDHNIFKYIIDNKLWKEILDFTNDPNTIGSENHKKYMNHFVEHFNFKLSQGKGVYHALPNLLNNDGKCPAVMFKMVQSCIHPNKDRLLNMRELLYLMGMPNDFDMQGNPYRCYAQIGQNVPVRTAYWIVSEALRAYDRENDLDEPKQLRVFDNIKQQEIDYK